MPGYYTRLFPVERISGGRSTLASNYSAAGVAPHADTIRWTYTVPSGRAAAIESAEVLVIRSVAAGVAAQVLAYITAPVLGFLLIAAEYDVAVGARMGFQVGLAGFANAGEQLNGRTADACAAGAHDFYVGARFREFLV